MQQIPNYYLIFKFIYTEIFTQVKQNGKETEETKGGDECAATENTSESTAEEKYNPDNVTQEVSNKNII